MPGERFIRCVAVNLNPAHTSFPPRWKDLDLFFLLYPAGDERARDHGAESPHRETAIDRKAEDVIGILRAGFAHELAERFNNLRNALTCMRTDPQHWRAFEKRPFQKFTHFDFDQIGHVGLDLVDLRQHRKTMLDVEERTDIEMLASLRHHGFVRCDDEHHHVDAADAGKHVLDEFFVAGNIDEADCCRGVEGEMREADVDRDAALLFLLQAIGVDAGERLYQRCFAVINMSGGSYDDVRHKSSCTSGSGSPITLK